MSKNLKMGGYFLLYVVVFGLMLALQYILVQHGAANEYLLLSAPVAILYYTKVGNLECRKKAVFLVACFLVSLATLPIYRVAPGTFLLNPLSGPISFLYCFCFLEAVIRLEPHVVEFKRRQQLDRLED